MCSLNDNDLDEEFQPLEVRENNDILDGIICQKCSENTASMKLRGKDVYCKSCFQISVTHKFRATLGKSKIVRPNDKVLVAHSGDGKSIVLLHLIKAGMHESVHKRLIFQTQVIYIDDGMINNQNIRDRQLKIEEINDQIQSFGFEVFAASLSVSLDENNFKKIERIENYSCSLNNSSDEQINVIFSNLKSDTSREDLLKKLRLKVIVKAAKLLGCKKIFFADDSTSLSICILTNVSLGRGMQLSLDVGYVDNRYGDGLLLMRPLRDFSRLEINYYLSLHNLNIINSKKLTPSANTHKSIRKLTKHFITELDSQFNGTISTIFRVSEKVSATVTNSVKDNDICILCNSPLDTSNLTDVISAIQATEFSKFISSKIVKDIKDENLNCQNHNWGHSADNLPVDTCRGECDENDFTAKKHGELRLEDILLCLCYGCRLIFNDNHDYKLLPKFLNDAAKEQLSLKIMRKQITDFLL